MKEKTLLRVVIIMLAVVLAVTGALAAYLYISNQRVEKELRSIQRQLDEIEENMGEQSPIDFTALSQMFMGELEGKVDEITQEIKEEIAAVENSFMQYDDDIESITSSLEELAVSMESANEVITDLQEILDSIKNFLRIE